MSDNYNWCVYVHTNKINKKQYIGITSQDPKKRWKNGNGYRHSTYFYNAILKYGWDNFDHEIICSGLNKKEACQKEAELISQYNTKKPNGYNLTDGGEGTRGTKMSKESIEKMTKTIKKLWENDEYKSKIIESRHDPLSTFQSEEFKKKISSLVSGENNPNYGNYWSDEQKASLSQKKKEDPRNKKGRNPRAKRIRCIETGEVFECIQDAADKYGVKCGASFTVALNNDKRTAAGLHWKTL